MAMMVRMGDLIPTRAGMISKQQTVKALLRIGVSWKVATETTDANFDHIGGDRMLNVYQMNTAKRRADTQS